MSLLLLSAAALGTLAFFEPCTIATNTLFAARSRRIGGQQCCNGLLLVWLARALLITLPLLLLTALMPAPAWSAGFTALLLALAGVVYLVSRGVYLPIPHIELYKLLPGGRQWPDALRLGLTLPACTLPLYAVVMGLSIYHGSLGAALLAGLLFATLFTLPTALSSYAGLGPTQRAWLVRAATAAPWVTAALFFAAALTLWLPTLSLPSLDTNSLRAVLNEASWAGIGVSLLAGLVFSFNPVSFAAIPVMLAYVTKAHSQQRALLLGAAFVLGLLVTHAVLGLAAALGGGWVQASMGRSWGLLLGPVLILLGLMWPGWLRISLPWFSMRGRRVAGVSGAFALAIPFSVAVCPFCAPALLVVLSASAGIGSVWYGLALLLAFAIGRSIPILLGAWSIGWLESLRVLGRYQRGFELLGGVVLVISGLYLLNEYFMLVGY